MITSVLSNIVPDLMDVVRLFPGAETLDIAHECESVGFAFVNRFRVGVREYGYENIPAVEDDVLNFDRLSLVKRYAKLALYRLLSEEIYKKKLPWGSLTGIRPTRLAYTEIEHGQPFEPLLRELMVSEPNIALVRRVIENQKGIYEKKEDNCDLYVSLPFCPSKCVYCSFITAPIEKTRQYLPAYLDCLDREIESVKPLMKNLRSVYVGGGTPFALEPRDLERVLKACAALANGREFTVEAGRADVFSKEKLQLCKDYGVTRICINAQSFSDRTLQAIGRKHTASAVEEAFGLAAPYGFTVNCDLIAGLTGESYEEFCMSVEKAIALAPENITVHTLCLKKGAKLKEETESLEEGALGRMIAFSRESLGAAGYEPYYLYRQKYMAGAHENVGWTKRGKACIYNVDVMEETTDNIAVGANAVSKKLFLTQNRIERYGSPKDIPTYIDKVHKIIEERNKLFS